MTYVGIAAGRPLAARQPKATLSSAAFIEECKHTKVAEADMATMEKKAWPPASTPFTRWMAAKVPVWVANFVLMNYGTGCRDGGARPRSARPRVRHQARPRIKPVIKPADGGRRT